MVVVTLGVLVLQVFPKMLDLYLLVLYASMVPVVYLQHRWLHLWIMVYHSGAVAVFMWVSTPEHLCLSLPVNAAQPVVRHAAPSKVPSSPATVAVPVGIRPPADFNTSCQHLSHAFVDARTHSAVPLTCWHCWCWC